MSNREELTRQAEKSLRQGRVEDAIALYQELADLTPVDWGIVKQLADLFERAGQREAASGQFCRWADHLAVEGFHSKAAALYKKVLKLEPSHEHALWQLGEVSLELKLRADARLAFQRVLELRQRRGDTAGSEVARDRLAVLEAAAPAPTRAPLSAAAVPPTGPTGPAIITDAAASVDAPPTPSEEAAAPPPTPSPAPAPVPPPDPPERRLARLRHEAEEAERRHPGDAEGRWHAVLEADPQDVATRMRLVQRAMDRRDLETAERLALPLDASETSALVLLAELAWRRGHPDALRRLVSGRVHAGASPGHILAPFDALASRLPEAARAALDAAVGAWQAAGQPGHAVAALELADRRGLLDTQAYLHWVEICVDAGVAGLSRAQAALARAYVAEGRVAEARAVAEDVFAREGGAEPYRALLLDVLDRLGEANPHRVLVDLLTPPSEVADEAAVGPRPVVDQTVDLGLDLSLANTEAGPAADGGLVDVSAAAAMTDEPPIGIDARAMAASSLIDAPRHDHPVGMMGEPVAPLVSPAADASASGAPGASASFDWAFLLGRDVDEGWGSGAPLDTGPVTEAEAARRAGATAASSPTFAPREADVPAAPAPLEAVADTLAPAYGRASTSVTHGLPADEVEPTPAPVTGEDTREAELDASPSPVPDAAGDAVQELHSALVAGPAPVSLGAPEHDPYEVRTPVDPVLARIAAAQPQMASPSEVLPPTFSIPSSWFDETPGDTTPARQRHPEDAYLFEDDDRIPSRWGARRPSPPASAVIPPVEATPFAPGASDQAVSPTDAIVAVGVPVGSASDEASRSEPAAPASEPDAPLASSTPGSGPADAGVPMPSELPEPTPELIDEEIDLTELLEELRQFDTVLPDPPARATPSERASDEFDMPSASVSPGSEVLASTTPTLADLLTPPPPAIEAPAPVSHATPSSPDADTELEAVFADLQRHTDDRLVAEQQLAAGRVFLAAGLVSEAARAFERASQAPRSRFAASQALAELHRSRGQLVDAVSWYEQAAAAPVPDADVKRPVLYDLAESLEVLGETDRALGVLLDLLSQVEDYRDARARLDRLLRVDAGG